MADLINRAKEALEGATPGPWKPFYDEVTSVKAADGRVAICAQITLMGRRHPTEAPANARLIAQAPDLAHALIRKHEAAECLARALDEMLKHVFQESFARGMGEIEDADEGPAVARARETLTAYREAREETDDE